MHFKSQILRSGFPYCNYVVCLPVQTVSLTKGTTKYWGKLGGLGHFSDIKPETDILILHTKILYILHSFKFLEIITKKNNIQRYISLGSHWTGNDTSDFSDNNRRHTGESIPIGRLHFCHQTW